MFSITILMGTILVAATLSAWPMLRLAVVRRTAKLAFGITLLLLGSVVVHVATADDAADDNTPSQSAPESESVIESADEPDAGDESKTANPDAATTATSPPSEVAPELEKSDENRTADAQPEEVKPAEEAATPKAAPAGDTVLNDPPQVGPTAVIVPPGRPKWVNSLPVEKGEVQTISVSSGPHARVIEANRELDAEIEKAARQYIIDYVGSEQAPLLLGFTGKSLRERLVDPADVYHETIIVSIGPMEQVHALLKFDDKFRAELDRRWTDLRMTARLGQLGLGIGGVLGLLATVCSYFRLDNATRGYYTGRLQFLAAAAILTLVAGGSMIARMILWM